MLDLHGSISYRRGFRGHRLAAAAGRCVLGGAGIRVLDLDGFGLDSQLLGHDHRHHGLRAGPEVAGPHVEVDASIGEELHDHGGWRPAAARKPQAACHADPPPYVALGGLWAGFSARLFPAEGGSSLFEAFLEAGGCVSRVALAGLAEARDVFQPELNRVHTDGLRQGIHHLLQSPGPLRVAGRAERPGRAGIDEDVGGRRAHVGAGVEIANEPVHQRDSAGRVGAARSETGELQRRERPVPLDTGLERHVAGGPVPHSKEGLLARQKQLHRTGGLFGQQGGDDGVLAGLEFASEPAPHVVADDPHPRQRNF